MQRAHALFGGAVTEIAEVEGHARGVTEPRKLSFNDHVRAGQLLAVVSSKDLGQMKNALVEALVRQQFDEETLARYRKLSTTGAISEAAIRTQVTAVSLDRNASESAEFSLHVSHVAPEEITAVKEEAKKIFARHGERDPEKIKEWPRVEVRSRLNGTIVEKNLVEGDTVDTSKDLFIIADLTKLVVWANAYEEDLRELNDLSIPHAWTVRLATEAKGSAPSESGPVQTCPSYEKISPAIDPNQHTATLMGRLDNRSGKLHPGQMVTATVELEQPGNTVAVPVSAVDDDGESSNVFVQPDANRPYFSQRRVAVVQRLADVVLVSSELSDAQRKSGLQKLAPGDRVVTRQTYVLRAALEDLKAKKQKKLVRKP
jgi:cobalt-zinc-cadmium efflux system membrane fusion protein